MFTVCGAGALRGQKKAPQPLAPELQTIVNCCLVVGTKPRSSESGASALNY